MIVTNLLTCDIVSGTKLSLLVEAKIAIKRRRKGEKRGKKEKG